MKQVNIFTDGSSRGNPGPGGWAAIIASETHVEELGGAKEETTNNRMELSGVIHALAYAARNKLKGTVIIHTDSSYVLNGATKWIHGWQKNNWKTKTKKTVLNQDLWVKLSNLLDQSINAIGWKLVKGHAGTAGNEQCDVIATSFADGHKPKLYNGPASDYKVNIQGRTFLNSQGSIFVSKKKAKTGKPYSYVSAVNGVVKTHATWAECEKRVKGVSGAKFKKSFSADDEQAIISSWKVSR